jgi:hypothetical protein
LTEVIFGVKLLFLACSPWYPRKKPKHLLIEMIQRKDEKGDRPLLQRLSFFSKKGACPLFSE